MAGRPRKSLMELALKGAFKKDPHRLTRRLAMPAAEGEVGDPPASLSRAEKNIWRELVEITPKGVLGKSDRLALEGLSRIVAQMRKYGIGGKAGISKGEQSTMLQLMGKLGLTPTDRQRLTIIREEEQDDSPYAEFLTQPDEKEQRKRPN